MDAPPMLKKQNSLGKALSLKSAITRRYGTISGVKERSKTL